MSAIITAFNSMGGFSVGEIANVVVLPNGDITTSNVSAVNGVYTDYLYYANGIPYNFSSAAGTEYTIQFNNGATPAGLNASENFKFNPESNLLSLDGKIEVTGNVTAAYFLGNVIGNISGNIVVPGTNTAVLYNNLGNAGASDALKFDYFANILTLTGNFDANVVNASQVIATTFTGQLTTNAQPNITSVGTLTSLNVANLVLAESVNVNTVVNTQSINVSDRVTTFRLTSSGINYPVVDGASGQAIVTDGYGNLGFVSLNTSNIGNGSSNASINTINGNLTISINGTANVFTVSETGAGVIGNISADAYYYSNGDPFVTYSNANVADYLPTYLGNLSSGNLSVANNVSSNLIPSRNITYELGSDTFKWNKLHLSANGINLGESSLTDVSGVLTTNEANIIGNITSNRVYTNDLFAEGNATINGNLTVAGSTQYINVTNLTIEDPLVLLGGSGNGVDAEAYDGKDRGLVLQNYRYDGSGPYNQFFGWKTSTNQFEARDDVTGYPNEVVQSTGYANIKADTFIGNLEGTLLTSAQPSITSLGTLVDLDVSNTATINQLVAGGLIYPPNDGVAGQVLTTNGFGTIEFTTPVSNRLASGNSNVSVNSNANVTISATGVANVVDVSSTVTSIKGNVTVTGNLTSNNLTSNNQVTLGQTQISWSTVTTTSTVPNQVIASVSAADIRGVVFTVKGEEAAGAKYSVESVSAVHNGTAVDYTVYGSVNMGGLTGVLAVSFAGGNIRLTVSPSSSNATVWTTQFSTI
jgi:hypothetical protein